MCTRERERERERENVCTLYITLCCYYCTGVDRLDKELTIGQMQGTGTATTLHATGCNYIVTRLLQGCKTFVTKTLDFVDMAHLPVRSAYNWKAWSHCRAHLQCKLKLVVLRTYEGRHMLALCTV